MTFAEADDTDAVVAPDGSSIVFTSNRSGNLDIWLLRLDGSEPVNLTNHPADDSQAAYSTETDRIFFQSNRFGLEDNTMVMLRDGSEQNSVTFDAVHSPVVLPLDQALLVAGAALSNEVRFCPVPGGTGVTECGLFQGQELISVTTHPEPPGAPWPGEDELIERTINRDCSAALDERFGADREPMLVAPVLVDEVLWDFGTRTTACFLDE